MTIQLLVLWVVCFAWLSSSISIGFLGLVQMRNGFLELPLSAAGFASSRMSKGHSGAASRKASDATAARSLEGACCEATDVAANGEARARKGVRTMYENILLAYDGSPDGREALAQAEQLASMSGATVRLLAILDLSENMLVVEGMSFIPDNQRFRVQSVLDAGVRHLEGAGCTATNDVRYGKPAEQIVLFAKEMKADLIVVGHRDQGSLARWLNGSVSATILHHPPCSVLVAVKSEAKSNVMPIRKTETR